VQKKTTEAVGQSSDPQHTITKFVKHSTRTLTQIMDKNKIWRTNNLSPKITSKPYNYG